jgi:DNA-binding response OmpR family regulator
MAERKSKVLIIEDDEYSGEAYAHLLNSEGYESVWAEDGAAGFEKAREMLPDAVILDLGLPDLHGIRVVELFRRDDALRTTPILVITGRDDDEAQSAIAAGANAYLTKPVEFNDLTRALIALGAVGNSPKRKPS